MDTCRICLDACAPVEEGNDLFYPCRCQAPVHPRCLDAWRTAGMNPANLTRCEVCQYHYRLDTGTKPWQIHFVFYFIAVFQIIFFFLIALGLGQLVRVTNIIEVVDWGRLSFMKPDTSRGWFFLGVCFNCFIIGSAATLYLLYLWVTGRLRRAAEDTRARRSITSEWWTTARQSRHRSRDCLRDCCHGSDDSCLLYCYLVSPDCYCYGCEACCGSCDAQCTECCQCCFDCNGCAEMPTCDMCGDCGENPCLIALLGLVMILAVVLLFIGMFVMFWTIIINLLYGIWLNQNYLREIVAGRYKVLEYNPQYDTEPVQSVEEPSSKTPNVNNDKTDKMPVEVPPQQAAMQPSAASDADAATATTIGKGMRTSSAEFVELEENFEGGTLVSVDLTGEAPETRRSSWNTNAL
ncbi:unnamed protein product [Cladocopium goreaui]|uniref:Serine hydroxymethyltransferase n=1 Tax=Cladocopium goreaui TaxID=2562237 RepID=A0A9P1DNP4_9DINO|nr:unnamed protein product [Cladocopium goreaui]|mmetsp:Transcript_9473/g.19742  ORF Transcript_9473/g.19742 Transcript_9473/m.19742 type:complete len:407 (+) Transcript_9473:84-1304(+)